MHDVRPPLLGRILMRLRRLADYRAEAEADLLELLHLRARQRGARHARRRYVHDAASLWTHRRSLGASPAVEMPAPRRGHPMRDLVHDLRYGLRMLAKSPGFSAVAILSLAIGIGANTTLFSIADAILLEKLPVKNPDSLVLLSWEAPRAFRAGVRGTMVDEYEPGRWGNSAFHHRMVTAFAEKQRGGGSPLTDLFAFAPMGDLIVVARGTADVVSGQLVSGSYFGGLGVSPLLGRTIDASDDTVTAEPAAVISHRYWQERFAGDPSVVGTTITVNQVATTIVGVTGADLRLPAQIGREPDITLALALSPRLDKNSPMVDRPERPAPYWPLVMGRLAPGATFEQARAFLEPTFQHLAIELMGPPEGPDEPATLSPSDYPRLVPRAGAKGMWEIRSIYSRNIYVLFGTVSLVLLIACANVANLLLSRSVLRAPEITLRLAMGAGRWRIVRQLLTESLLLAGIGGALGVVLSIWGIDAAAAAASGGVLPNEVEYGLNLRVLAFSTGVSLATGLLFGVVPAWRGSRRDLTLAIRDTARSGTGASRSWLSRGLVVAQVATSLILLAGAGLFVRTLANLQRVDTGFDQENPLVFGVSPGDAGYDDARLAGFYADLASRLDAIPGVRASTFSQSPLVAYYMWGVRLLLPGETAANAPRRRTNLLTVRENFIETMGVTLVRGRGFTRHDGANAQKVAIINETLARQFFKGGDPIGQRIGFDAETENAVEIIGITRDIIYNSQREDKAPLVYVPWRQREPHPGMFFMVRTAGDPLPLVDDIRRTVRAIDPALPVEAITTQTAQSRKTLSEERQYAALVGFAAALALGLAAIGIYGVIAYWVTQRTAEIGLRMALGAQTSSVLRLVLAQGVVLVIAGVAAGCAGFYSLAKLVESRLYGIDARDPLTLVVVGLLLLAVALLACAIPARRAARLDPMIALRID